MVTDSQQKETLDYFRNYASQWRDEAEGKCEGIVNVVEQRNQFVQMVASASKSIKRALDVGCGTGELVCELARTGIETVGIDFAEEMIALSKQKAATLGNINTAFIHTSIFDYDPGDLKFDLVSANGFIEYISQQELVSFLARMKHIMSPGASLVLGSRNRLFNIFSLNEFTDIEIDNNAAVALLQEALVIAKALNKQECIQTLLSGDALFPQIDEHPHSGIKVSTRYQYTPGELIRLLHNTGFSIVDLYPVHYHGALPRFARNNAEVHVAFANMMQSFSSTCHYLIPFSTTFMLHVMRSE